MPIRHQYSVLFAVPLLVLAAASGIEAGEDWNCVSGPGGSGWSCAGQDKYKPRKKTTSAELRSTPEAQPSATKDKATKTKKAAAVAATRTPTKTASTPVSDSDKANAEPQPAKKTSGSPTRGTSTTRKPALAAAATTPVTGRTSGMAAPSDNSRTASSTGGTPTKSTAPRAATQASNPKTATTSKTGTTNADSKTPSTKPRASAARSGNAKRLHEGLDWEYCGPRTGRFGAASLPPQPSADDQLFVGADTFDYDQELQILSLQGDVQMVQGSRQVGADRITYDRASTDLVAEGHTYLSTPGARLIADDAQLNLESDKGKLSNVDYRLSGTANARGSADRAELVNSDLTKFSNIHYTACPPGREDWSLDAAELELDQATGVGVARNAKLRVGGVPVLYTPYLSFPIDSRRKSGVLVPTLGNSDDNGIDVTVPYYWNIAPNMDATFFPRYMSKRGAMLGTEFRFLTPRQEGEIFGEFLPEDRNYDDGGSRWGFRAEHKGRYGSGWSSNVTFSEVSDDEYLEDFGNQLDLTSVRNIERRGDLFYRGDGWNLRSRLQDFQTVDTNVLPRNRPYARLPQLLFTMPKLDVGRGVQLGLGGEYNYFRHGVKVQGHRAALQPYAVWPIRKSYGHLIPQLNVYLAGYDLQDQTPGKSDTPSYALPSFNLDGELVFERTVQWFDQESLQTLEPRIYYLYTPYKNQEDQPVFDSSELSFSFNSLFRQNRFTGRDRIGDANQLTLGLTSRTLSMESGKELLRASVGQILYFRDRDVQISGLPEDESTSAIAGELSARILDNWSGRASFQWDPNAETDRSRKRALELHYQSSDDRLLNLVYRFDLGTSEATRYEDTDLSFRMPVNRQIQLVGRWYYSLLYSETLEAFAGVEYGQCCWRMRLVGHHLKNKPDSAGSNSFMVQMELAGMGSIGQQIDNFLERGIYGYHAD